MPPRSQKFEIAPSIGILLALYWQPDEAPGTRDGIADAWLEDLVEFDVTVVAESCREWRRSQTRRPVLADIYKLCRENQDIANRRAERALPKPEGEAPAWFDAGGWSVPEYDGDSRIPWQRRSDAIAAQQAKRLPPDEMLRDGRALCNQWARLNGYADFTAAERAGRTHSEVVTWVLANQQLKQMPFQPDDPPLPAGERGRIRRHSLIEAAAA